MQESANGTLTAALHGLPMTGRDAFLASLKARGKDGYKRYIGSPLRYAGGKSLAVGYIAQRIPQDIDRIVSPFIGGGSVEIACANELGLDVVAYDLFDILCTYWQVQLSDAEVLTTRLKRWEPTQETYRQVKERLRAHWKGETSLDDPVELAAHYWFNHNLSYGPGFLGWMSRIYKDPVRYERLLGRVESFNCPNLEVHEGSFEGTIPQHDGDFLYCDPPYYLDGDSRMFRGIYPQRNFPVHHNRFDHAAMRELLGQHHGGFILSYNDCSAIREMYADYSIVEVGWQYTLGQGETRIGKNRIENGVNHNIKDSHEILIIGDRT